MAIDLYRKGRIVKRGDKQTKSTNVYVKLLIKLYKFLARRTDSKFNKVILKRLAQTNISRHPLSLGRLIKNNVENKINVIVSTITDDCRILNVPKLNVCALRVTESARLRIQKAGGKIYTFDQLAQIAPTGKGTNLLRGPKVREAYRHWVGKRGDKAAPYVRHEGRKFERGHSGI